MTKHEFLNCPTVACLKVSLQAALVQDHYMYLVLQVLLDLLLFMLGRVQLAGGGGQVLLKLLHVLFVRPETVDQYCPHFFLMGLIRKQKYFVYI